MADCIRPQYLVVVMANGTNSPWPVSALLLPCMQGVQQHCDPVVHKLASWGRQCRRNLDQWISSATRIVILTTL